MIDKQIMINGVDVSGCDFYDKNKKYCLTLKMDTTGFKNPSCFSGDFQKCIQDSKVCPYTFCDNNPNCYYKQLKAKEQECEELKGLCNGLDTTIDNYTNLIELRNQQLDQLKAENDKYSFFIEKLCDYAGLECDNEEQAMKTLSDLASQMNKARWIIDKLKQTLTEIKEIAEPIEQNTCFGLYCGAVKQILQKISEVEDEN